MAKRKKKREKKAKKDWTIHSPIDLSGFESAHFFENLQPLEVTIECEWNYADHFVPAKPFEPTETPVPVTMSDLRRMATEGCAEADGMPRSAVTFDSEGGFKVSEN